MSEPEKASRCEKQPTPEYGLLFRMPTPIAILTLFLFLFGLIPVVVYFGLPAGVIGIGILWLYSKISRPRNFWGPMWLSLVDINIFLVNITWSIIGVIAIARIFLN